MVLSPGARPSPLDSPPLERRFSGVQDVEAQPLGRPKPPTHAPTHRCCCGSRPRNGFGDEPSPSSRKDFGVINLRANNARAERGGATSVVDTGIMTVCEASVVGRRAHLQVCGDARYLGVELDLRPVRGEHLRPGPSLMTPPLPKLPPPPLWLLLADSRRALLRTSGGRLL